MPQGDNFILVVVGGIFIILGIAAIIWGMLEEKGYYNRIAARAGDLREFVNHWPPRLQPGALKIGGCISLAVGLVVGAVRFAGWLAV